MNTEKSSTSKVIPIFFVFLCMGFADVVGPLVGLVKDTFSVSNFVAQLLPFSGFLMFGIFSIPIGIFQDKKGKKFILTLGLTVAFLGLILPILNGMYGPKVVIDAGAMWKFYAVLIAIMFLGAGATILQVAGNPIMRDVSPEGKYSSNLSLGQSIKAIGSSMGFLLPPAVAAAFGMDWSILFPLFAVLILVTGIWVGFTHIEEKKYSDATPATFGSCFKLLANPFVLMMVMGIFLYVGAEVSMSSQVPILMKESFGMEQFGLWVSWSLFFLPIFLGRFAGSMILRFLSAKKFLIITALLSIVGILALLFGSKTLAFAGIFLSGLSFANIFPLIFSITVDSMPERANELSGLMITAIVGGAFIPPITGAVADASSVLLSFIVPLACILYITWTALVVLRKQ